MYRSTTKLLRKLQLNLLVPAAMASLIANPASAGLNVAARLSDCGERNSPIAVPVGMRVDGPGVSSSSSANEYYAWQPVLIKWNASQQNWEFTGVHGEWTWALVQPNPFQGPAAPTTTWSSFVASGERKNTQILAPNGTGYFAVYNQVYSYAARNYSNSHYSLSSDGQFVYCTY